MRPRPLRSIPHNPFRVVSARDHGDVAKGQTGTAYREADNQVRVHWDVGTDQLYTGGDVYACLKVSQ